MPRSPILPIQYLRGIAALMVVWHHAVGQVAGVDRLYASEFGTLGVDLFFVISGFIMVVTTAGRPMSPADFFWRRLLRVAPLYWLLTLLMLALYALLPAMFKTLDPSPASVLQSLAFIPHYSNSHPGEIWPLLVPGWSLNIEMFFYAVFALSLAVPRWSLALLCAVCGGLVAIGLAFGPFESAWAVTYTRPILLEFVAGALLGGCWVHGLRLRSTVLAFGLLLLGVGLLAAHGRVPLGVFNQQVGALLVVGASLAPVWQRRHWPLLQALGDASYSVYLTHLFTLGFLRVLWKSVVPVTNGWAASTAWMGLALLVSAGVGWLFFRAVERPLTQRLQRQVPHPAPRVASA